MRQVFSAFFAVSLVFALSVGVLAQDLQDDPAYIEGLKAGQEMGRAHPSMFLAGWGVVFGGFAVLHAMFTEVVIPDEIAFDINSQSPAYQAGFERGFKQAAKNQKVLYGLGGWSTWLLLGLLAR